jgi:hypothetical protein
MEKKYQYKNWSVVIEKKFYKGARTALQFTDAETGEPVLKATVNIPSVKLKKDEVLIKYWGENEGVLTWLQNNGLVGPTLSTHESGYVQAYKVKLLTQDL